MSWRNNIQQASFRGVTFSVKLAETGIGRRTEMHVWPNTKLGAKHRDWVWAEDLGTEPDEFRIEGFIIQTPGNGFDYFEERDKLIKALKTFGPGDLVHPYFKDKLRVSVMGKAKITETFDEGGIARFEMNFVQYNKPIFTGLETDHIAKIDASALALINQALDTFTDLMNTAGAFLSTLTSPITTMMTKIQSAINSVNGAVASTISTALGVVSSAISLVDTLLNSPCALANQILNAADAVLGLVGMAGDVVQGGIVGGCSGIRRGDTTELRGKEIPESLGTSTVKNFSSEATFTSDDLESPTIEQENNIELLATTQQSMMTANAARMAIRIEFSSQEQMLETMEQVTDSLDGLIDRLGSVSNEIDDSALFQTVTQLRADFTKSMLEKNVGLTKQIDYAVPYGVISTLELAYNKYNDINRDQDIYKRNRTEIRHPGFLPSGDEIRILNE